MHHTDTTKPKATIRTPCHASHGCQQIASNKSYISPCLTQIPANHRQQNRMNIFPSCLTQIPANHRQLSVHLTTPHTDSSKSQATNRITYHASHRYQQIAGNKSYILPCLTQLPANHRQQIVHLAMPHADTSKSHAANRASYQGSYRYQQITGNKPYTFPCLPANQRQKVVHLAMSHTTQIPANHKQQIVHLIMPYTDTLDNKSYILPCLKQVPASHRQQAVHLSIPHTDTSK